MKISKLSTEQILFAVAIAFIGILSVTDKYKTSGSSLEGASLVLGVYWATKRGMRNISETIPFKVPFLYSMQIYIIVAFILSIMAIITSHNILGMLGMFLGISAYGLFWSLIWGLILKDRKNDNNKVAPYDFTNSLMCKYCQEPFFYNMYCKSSPVKLHIATSDNIHCVYCGNDDFKSNICHYSPSKKHELNEILK